MSKIVTKDSRHFVLGKDFVKDIQEQRKLFDELCNMTPSTNLLTLIERETVLKENLDGLAHTIGTGIILNLPKEIKDYHIIITYE